MKTDSKLGHKVAAHLVSLGIETPMVDNGFTPEQKIEGVRNAIRNAMEVLCIDLSDDSLHDTPNRVAKMWVNEIFSGLDYNNFPKITVIDNKMNCDEMVLVKNMTAISSCEHHLITVDQTCSIAYIPGTKVLGLSKFARIAKFFANRPEVQERYVAQVFETVKFLLETENVAVSVKGKHYCMIGRGVEDINAETVTNKLGGLFKTDAACRNEFFKCLENY